ncbi:unnamed protein product, partial [Rotaria sordida]
NCYTHLQCNRGPSPACLDWTEICDGQVDCIDDKVNEKDCWKIEIHVCQDDEFQCSNGQCIPMAFYRDDDTTNDCADSTDERSPQLIGTLHFIYKQPSFINEENQFLPLPIGNFNFGMRRSHLFQALFLAKDNSTSEDCWSALRSTIQPSIYEKPLFNKTCVEQE